MRDVSPAEVERQIRREGARFGLFPLFQNGKCFVAQKQLQVTAGGVVGQLVEELVAICSVNMDAPLGNVHKSRKQRFEFDMPRIYKEARLRREAAAKKAADDRADDRARELVKLGRRFGTRDVALAQMRALSSRIARQGR